MTGPFTVLDCEQRSPEWHQARLGRLTGSRAYDAFKTIGGGKWSANRKDLKIQLALEWITGESQEDRGSSRAMRTGIEREPLNRYAYEVATGSLVKECGFLADNELPIGVSLDGYLGDFEGAIECKAPKESTHLETFTQYRAWLQQRDAITSDAELAAFTLQKGDGKIIAPEYLFQIRHTLYCTGAAWCDYVSFCPTFPRHAQLVIIRVLREDCQLEEYERLVREFLDEVDQQVKKVMAA